MVAVLHSGSNLRGAVNYNENKVEQGVASCIDAGYYLKEPAELSQYQKLSRLTKRNALNDRVKANSVHISLNFAPDENLPVQKLKEIAALYMDRIGFARQPYLLYQHHDSGHPHLHVVTTNIRADGSRISMHNIGRNQSEKARKEIEITYNLVRAEDHKRHTDALKQVDILRVQYGKSETKRAISNVLLQVLKTYKYTSLPELNAILQCYNVTADQGSKDSRIYKNNGLVYRVLAVDADKTGVPIKASSFHFKPTLNYLSQQFALHARDRLKHRARLKNAIDLALNSQAGRSIENFIAVLEKEGVTTILRQNEGQIYGITYVDHRTKCVFNGSALGKSYSAQAIQQSCSRPVSSDGNVSVEQASGNYNTKPDMDNTPDNKVINFPKNNNETGLGKLAEELISPIADSSSIPWQLRKTRRKKRKKTIS